MKYTRSFRIWHWVNALVIFALMGTVFLRETFLSYKTNAPILLNKLTEFGVTITQDQAQALAKVLRNEMWQWHIYLGYALVALILYRIFLVFKDDSKKEGFFQLPFPKKMVKLLHYLFYIATLAISVSGFALYFHDTLNIDEVKLEDIKEAHEMLFNFIGAFVALHVVGVVVAENRDEEGIISTMVHGQKVDS